MPKHIGDISNLISKPAMKPKKPPSRIEVLEGRVATLESALKTVLSELTALRADVEGLKTSTAKPPATETAPKPPSPPKVSKRPRSTPWDDMEIRLQLEAVRPRILELLSDGEQITKQGCADALNIAATLAGRTLSYMMTQTKEITMISPPKTEDDPDPKKLFRLKP